MPANETANTRTASEPDSKARRLEKLGLALAAFFEECDRNNESEAVSPSRS